MKKLHFLAAILLFSSAIKSQPTVKITWSGELNCEYYPLDSVIVTNKSNGKTAVFYYPADTMLVYGGDVGIRQ